VKTIGEYEVSDVLWLIGAASVCEHVFFDLENHRIAVGRGAVARLFLDLGVFYL